MEKRYQVFVSSTFRDLQEERTQVIQALLELDCIPAGMELFPASDEAQWTLIKRVIDDCDYYVVIVGGRYGSVDADGVSYTEKEYDYAISKGIPVLGFVHTEPTSIPIGKSEDEPKARERLAAFRAKVETKTCKGWRTPQELGGVVSRSLIQTIKTHPGEGWVRARYASSPEQVNELRNQIESLSAELDHARTEPPPDAANLAKGGDAFKVRFINSNYSDVSYGNATLTWDEIFSVVGPTMFQDAPESELRRVLIERIAMEGDLTNYERDNIEVVDEDFQTVKVQLIALGLIQKSTQKRGVKDTQTYWQLTPYGERYITVLKAIRAT